MAWRRGAVAAPAALALGLAWTVLGSGAEASGADSPPSPAPPAGRPTLFRTDAARCGWDGGPVPRGLKVLWRFAAGADEMVLASPAVVAGRVYAATCVVDIASTYGRLVCLDAGTGRLLWAAEDLDGQELKGFFSSPAVTADGRCLVIGQGLHDDRDCSLLCVETETGRLRWRVKTPLHIEGSPAIHGDLAVAGAGAIEGKDFRPVGDPGFVLAVRISDGRELWRHAVPDPESSPAVGDDGLAYIGSGFGGCAVYALRTAPEEDLRRQGLQRLAWRTPTPYPAVGAVTLAGDLVVIGCGNGNYVRTAPRPAGVVMALDRRTGQVRWRTPMPDVVLGPVAAGEGRLLCAVRNGQVVALGLADGKPLWPQPRAVSGSAPLLAGPALAADCVYAVSQDGYLAVLRAADGTLLERHYLNAPGRPGEMGLTLSSPTVAGGRLYVGSETGGLWCFGGSAP